MAKKQVIVIDGPAGAGKSTVARMLAARLGYRYLDTGALYRAVALAAYRKEIVLDETDRVERLCREVTIQIEEGNDHQHVYLDGDDVTDAIRTPEMSMMASRISQQHGVRKAMLRLQRELGRSGVVAEGRDMGTIVFPEADVKFFLDADPDERGARRHRELVSKGFAASLSHITEETARRDEEDRRRDIAPLRQGPDAIYIDSTHMTPDEVVASMMKYIRAKG